MDIAQLPRCQKSNWLLKTGQHKICLSVFLLKPLLLVSYSPVQSHSNDPQSPLAAWTVCPPPPEVCLSYRLHSACSALPTAKYTPHSSGGVSGLSKTLSQGEAAKQEGQRLTTEQWWRLWTISETRGHRPFL